MQLPRSFPGITVLCLLSIYAVGQGETTSAIQGQATDSTGAVVSGATVRVASLDTGLKRSARTDESGRFNFPQPAANPEQWNESVAANELAMKPIGQRIAESILLLARSMLGCRESLNGPTLITLTAGQGQNSLGAKSFRSRRQVCHSWSVPGDSEKTC
jgi:hypothetical protein